VGGIGESYGGKPEEWVKWERRRGGGWERWGEKREKGRGEIE